MGAAPLLDPKETWRLAEAVTIEPRAVDEGLAALAAAGGEPFDSHARRSAASNAAELLNYLRFACARDMGDETARRQLEIAERLVAGFGTRTGTGAGVSLSAMGPEQAASNYARLRVGICLAVRAGSRGNRLRQWWSLGRVWRREEQRCAAWLATITRPFARQLQRGLDPFKRFGLTAAAADALASALEGAPWIAEVAGKEYRPWHGTVAEDAASRETDLTPAQAVAAVAKAFGASSPAFCEVVRTLEGRGLLDVGSEPERQDLAFCTVFRGSGVPRIFATLNGSIHSLIVLAHEVGHALHHYKVAGLKRRPPVALAETAAMLGERWFTKANRLDRERRRAALLYLGTVPAIFKFERDVSARVLAGRFDARDAREVMRASLAPVFGEKFADLDAWMWIRLPQLFMPGTQFSGMAYTFAYLLSGCIERKMAIDPARAHALYESFGRSMEWADLKRFSMEELGGDLESRDFWTGALEAERCDLRRKSSGSPL